MADYVLTPTARKDMRAIREYVRDFPEHIRRRQIDGLMDAFDQAARFRFSGRREPEL